MKDVVNILEQAFPGLYARVEAKLVEAEARFNGRSNQGPSEFLVEHSRRTAAIAHTIAKREGVDPLLPILVALFHDAGKFHLGEYHNDGVPEEEHAAVLADEMLADFGLIPDDIEAVTKGLRALYDDRLPCVGPCRIVQDADRLDKLGALGVGAFFTKAVLRGRGLIDALAQTLSRELTYALAAQRSIFTETGKQLARVQAAKTVAYFDDLLDQLESWGIAFFERRTIVLEEEFRTRDGGILRGMEVTIVVPRACPRCEAPLALGHVRDRSVKCERLTAHIRCDGCGYARETALCLPVA